MGSKQLQISLPSICSPIVPNINSMSASYASTVTLLRFLRGKLFNNQTITVETNKSLHYKSLHYKSLRFAIFLEIFENCQLKILLNSKILQTVTVFWNFYCNYLVVGTAYISWIPTCSLELKQYLLNFFAELVFQNSGGSLFYKMRYFRVSYGIAYISRISHKVSLSSQGFKIYDIAFIEKPLVRAKGSH